MTPTARSLAWLREHGYDCEMVERRTRYATYDFIGVGDIMAWKPGEVLLVQATSGTDNIVGSGGHVAERLAKVRASVRLPGWLRATPAHHVEIHGWGLRGPRGKPKSMVLLRIRLNRDLGIEETRLEGGSDGNDTAAGVP